MDEVSISYLFSFSRYQTKCVIEFLFRQLMTSWTLRLIFDHPLKQCSTGRKRGKVRNTKNWISWERKELFRWNKKHFSLLSKSNHLVKIWKKRAQALKIIYPFFMNCIFWVFAISFYLFLVLFLSVTYSSFINFTKISTNSSVDGVM